MENVFLIKQKTDLDSYLFNYQGNDYIRSENNAIDNIFILIKDLLKAKDYNGRAYFCKEFLYVIQKDKDACFYSYNFYDGLLNSLNYEISLYNKLVYKNSDKYKDLRPEYITNTIAILIDSFAKEKNESQGTHKNYVPYFKREICEIMGLKMNTFQTIMAYRHSFANESIRKFLQAFLGKKIKLEIDPRKFRGYGVSNLHYDFNKEISIDQDSFDYLCLLQKSNQSAFNNIMKHDASYDSYYNQISNPIIYKEFDLENWCFDSDFTMKYDRIVKLDGNNE